MNCQQKAGREGLEQTVGKHRPGEVVATAPQLTPGPAWGPEAFGVSSRNTAQCSRNADSGTMAPLVNEARPPLLPTHPLGLI